jgi:fibronectin-binding autotransporter adhesin
MEAASRFLTNHFIDRIHRLARAVVSLLRAVVLIAACINSASAADIKWGGETGFWSNVGAPGGWIDSVPGPADTAIIEYGSVAAMTDIEVGALILHNREVSTFKVAATLGGIGTVTLGSLSWAEGVMDGGGTTFVSGTASLSGSWMDLGAFHGLGSTGRTLKLAGDTSFGGNQLAVGFGSNVINTGTFTSNRATSDNSISDGTGTNIFRNDGTYVQDSGVNTTRISTFFDNKGITQVRTGTLILLGGGSSSGSFAIQAGGVLHAGTALSTGNLAIDSGSIDNAGTFKVGGKVDVAAGVSLKGSGTLAVSGGTLNLASGVAMDGTVRLAVSSGTLNTAGTVNPAGVDLSFGALSGAGTVNTGTLLWTGGEMSGGGITTVTGDASITGKGSKQLTGTGRTLNLEGTTAFNGGILYVQYGAALNNGGTFTSNDVSADSGISTYDSTKNVFSNIGTYVQNSGTKTTRVYTFFDNRGITQVKTGTLILLGGGSSSGSFATLAGGTLQTGSFDSSGSLAINSGSIDNAGTFRANGTVNVASGVAVTGPGTLTVAYGGTLNLASGVTSDGKGTLDVSSGTLSVAGTFNSANLRLSSGALGGAGTLNTGTLLWTGGQMQGGVTTVSGDAGISGQGTKNLSGGRTVNLQGNTAFSGAGSLRIDYGSSLNNRGTFTSNEVSADSSISSYDPTKNVFTNIGTYVQNSGTKKTTVGTAFDNKGAIEVQSGSLYLNGLLNYKPTTQTLTGGTFRVGGGVLSIDMGPNHGVVHNAASIVLDGSTAEIRNLGSDGLVGFRDNQAGGRFELLGGAAYTRSGAFANAGDIVIGTASAFTVAGGGDYSQSGGLTIVNGVLAASNVLVNGGTVDGFGTINGNLTINAGMLGAGDAVGRLAVAGSFNQAATSVFNVQIAGYDQGAGYDWLAIGGISRFGGKLRVAFDDSFNAKPDDIFTLVTYASWDRSEFSGLLVSGLGSGYLAKLRYTDNALLLQVAAVPEPESYAMMLAGLGLIRLMARRRQALLRCMS